MEAVGVDVTPVRREPGSVDSVECGDRPPVHTAILNRNPALDRRKGDRSVLVL
jgi:hypothetical protein